MTSTRPFALRLFVPSGLPEGMRIVEKTNWVPIQGSGWLRANDGSAEPLTLA